ncbi:MAG: ABC transporter ATP-binding protein [Sedimentisphaerales bacterium]|nr:ABC transporter ATP-binding protein [Sedimentisphaerales bacterium]
MSENVIRAENLSRDYGRFRALDNLNLNIPRGRVVALLGPNGAGKTTFIKLLMGLLEPTEGKSFVLDNLSRALPGSVVSKIGYMGDMDEPPGWSTIRQLMEIQAGAAAKFEKEYFVQAMKKHELNLNKTYSSLSKGQKKWVRAALVLAGKPDVLLLDEPVEGMDPSARKDMYDQLRDYVTDTDAAAIVATHVIGDIERVADDVAIINHGHLVTYADLEELREQVREVQLGADEDLPELGDEIEVLGSKTADGAKIVWIKCPEKAREILENLLGEKIIMWTVSLETFYLAITEHNSNNTQAHLKEIEK